MEKVSGYDVTGGSKELNDIEVDLNANIKRIYWRYTNKYTGSGRLMERLACG
jgi:hypothetical protein